MKSTDFITEKISSLSALVKQAGYNFDTTLHTPKHEANEAPVEFLENLIKNAGYERIKAHGPETRYQYDVDGEIIVFDYRYAGPGLMAWWRNL